MAELRKRGLVTAVVCSNAFLKLGQTQADGTRFATGLRQMPAITWDDGACARIWVASVGRRRWSICARLKPANG